MGKKRPWKLILEYSLGVLILLLTILLAWFAPDWYNSWKDEGSLGKVTMNTREEIQFLNRDSLDMAGKMQLLAKKSEQEWEYSTYNVFNPESQVERCAKLVQLWAESGLLPSALKELAMNYQGYSLDGIMINLGEQSVNTGVFRFQIWLPHYRGQGVTDYDELILSVIMDLESDLLYYVSISGIGEILDDYFSQIAGYESYEEFMKAGEVFKEEDYSRYDFAAVCGAQSARVQQLEETLELEVELDYGNFTGHAYRIFVENDWYGSGIAFLVGTYYWSSLMGQIGEAYGYQEYQVTAEEALGLPLVFGEEAFSDGETQDLGEDDLTAEEQEKLLSDGGASDENQTIQGVARSDDSSGKETQAVEEQEPPVTVIQGGMSGQ